MLKVQFKTKIVSNKKICPKYFSLVLDKKFSKKEISAGQFLNIKVSDGLKPLFRRPFSISRFKDNLEVLYEPVGEGTKILSQKEPGEILDVLGPLGNNFIKPEKDVKQIVFIAGGVGVAPFIGFSDDLKSFKGNKIILFGVRTKEHTFNLDVFRNNGFRVFISTDDGSKGVKGRVSELFSKIDVNEKGTICYVCGPKPMMRSAQDFVIKNNLSAQGSFEEVMACGIGTCRGCVIKTKSGFKTVCNDGPVFDLKEIIF